MTWKKPLVTESQVAGRPSNAGRPVIYLDSSDFSNLSNAGKPDWQAHRAHLLQVVAEDRAEFRFSAVHVMEVTHVDAASKRWSSGRAQTIKDLCGVRCLMFWNDLVFAEGIALVEGRTLSRDEVHRDDGRWTPAIDLAAREMRELIRREVKDAARQLDVQLRAEGVSGLQRKSLRRSLKGGRLPSHLMMTLDTKEVQADLSAALQRMHLAGDPAQVNVMRRMAFGDLSSAELQQACVELVTDLPAFVGHHFDTYGGLVPFFGSLRETGAALREGAATIREAVTEMTALKDAAFAKAWLNQTIQQNPFAKARRSILATLGRQQADRLRLQGIRRRDWEQSVVESEVGRIPALDIVFGSTLEHVRRNASPGAKSKLLDSTFADMLHLAYLPYVDVLRCDAETSQVAAGTGRKFGTRVAASFKNVLRLFDGPVEEAGIPD